MDVKSVEEFSRPRYRQNFFQKIHVFFLGGGRVLEFFLLVKELDFVFDDSNTQPIPICLSFTYKNLKLKYVFRETSSKNIQKTIYLPGIRDDDLESEGVLGPQMVVKSKGNGTPYFRQISFLVKYFSIWPDTVDGRNPAPVEVGRLSHYLPSQVVGNGISEPSTVPFDHVGIPGNG